MAAMLRDVVVRRRRRRDHAPAIHAASHVDHEKRIAWLCISADALGSVSYSYGAPLKYNTIQCKAMQYNTIQCNAMQYNTMQCNTMQYNTIQYNAIQCNARQVKRVQYSTV